MTEEVLGMVADAGPDDAAAAIAAARRAFDESGWSTDRALRHRCLTQLRDGLREQAQELYAQVVAEVGATMAITAGGPQGSGPMQILDYYLDLMHSYRWEEELPVTRHMGVPSKRLLWREAAGVVAAITPWNMPFQINIAQDHPGACGRVHRGAQGGPGDPLDSELHRTHRCRAHRPAAGGAQHPYLQ